MTLRSVPEFITAPPARRAVLRAAGMPLVVMLVVAVARCSRPRRVLASSTLIRGVSLDQLRETPT